MQTFKKIRKEKYETQVDDRFKEMMTSEKFSLGPGIWNFFLPDIIAVDYLLHVCTAHPIGERQKKTKKKKRIEVQGEHESAIDDKQGSKAKKLPVTKETRLDYLTRLSRGEVDLSSSSDDDSEESLKEDISSSASSTDSDEDYDSQTEGVDPLLIPDDTEVGLIEDATNRLAIQNCEWNSVRAEDLMYGPSLCDHIFYTDFSKLNRVILQSFCSPGMRVESVTVYPSDFGLERMKYEEIHGPPKSLWKKSKKRQNGSSDSEYEIDKSRDR